MVIATATFTELNKKAKALTTSHSFKELIGRKPFKITNIGLLVAEEDEVDERMRVVLEVDGVMYSGISTQVVEMGDKLMRMASAPEELAEFDFKMEKSSGKYGRFNLEIV